MPDTPYLVTRGVVLRETLTKETDKILTLLTETHGKLPVIARGARRKNSKHAAAAQTLVWSEWSLYRRGDWYYAREETALELFEGLRGDLDALALAFYFAELTEAVALEDAPPGPLLPHLLNGLYALSTLHKPPELVKPAFEWKLLSFAGYEPFADACAYCGTPDPEIPVFDTVQGVLSCQTCGAAERSPAVVKPLCRDSLAALRHAVYGDAKKLYAFRLSGAALDRFSQAAEAFTAAQLERKFKTLDFYKSLHTGGYDNGKREGPAVDPGPGQ